MKILGIETSCDETAIAVVEAKNGDFKILSNVVSSQVKVHRKWGGVVPNLARREHQRNLTFVLKQALEEAGMLHKMQNAKFKMQNHKSKFKIITETLERESELSKKITHFLQKYKTPNIDLIAVVNGPGLEPALWVGVNFAKAIAHYWGKPIVPINHLEAHLLTNWLKLISANSKSETLNSKQIQKSKLKIQNIFPAICLLVSGGHTMLVIMQGIGKYKMVGETRDDSAGECFDKTARLLGLGYPGGPAIAEAANKALPRYRMQIKLPRPMLNSKDYDFSFSGLKTAVLYHYRSQPARVQKSKNYIRAMATEIQQAIIDVLIAKTICAAKEYKVKTVMIGGGVAANAELRCQLSYRVAKELPGTRYLEPDVSLCTDNGVMAAVAGYFNWRRFKKGMVSGKSLWSLKADANLKI